MNAKEIVDKFKEILLSKPEEVATEAIEVQEEVVLSEQEQEVLAEDMPEDEMAPEDVIEDVVEEAKTNTQLKKTLAKEIAALKAMI